MPEQIEQYMRTLKLGGMAREWRNVEFQSTEQYVRELLELELREREVNRINRMVKTAGFQVIKTLEDFVWNQNIELPVGLTREYMEGLQFLPQKENLIFLGSVGTGKTHLAAAIALSRTAGEVLHSGISGKPPAGAQQQGHAEQLPGESEAGGAHCGGRNWLRPPP